MGKYLIILFFVLVACGDNEIQNRVDYRLRNSDNSTNYKYMFKEDIKRDQKNRNLLKKRDDENEY